jgi:hypothetical protein
MPAFVLQAHGLIVEFPPGAVLPLALLVDGDDAGSLVNAISSGIPSLMHGPHHVAQKYSRVHVPRTGWMVAGL